VSGVLAAIASLDFDTAEGHSFRLPGSGSRSLLYVFAGAQVGAHAKSADGEDFTPGSSHSGVRLTFWDPAARDCVRPGPFDIWYGGIVGHGHLEEVLPEGSA